MGKFAVVLAAAKSGLVKFEEKSRLIEQFVERPKSEDQIISQWVSSGIYVINPQVLDYIPKKRNGSTIIDFPEHIFPHLLRKKQLFAYPVDRDKYYQLGIDTPERVKKAEADLQQEIFKPPAEGEARPPCREAGQKWQNSNTSL